MSSPPLYSASIPGVEGLDRIRGGLVDILKTEEGSRELERGSDEPTDSALAVERNFRDVADGFRETEKIRCAEPHHSNLVAMRKRWTTYQNEYKRLLWLSRNMAGKAHATIYDFIENILYVVNLPDTEMSFGAKKAELDAYVKKLKDDQSSSQTELAVGFESLQEKIASFRRDFDALSKDFQNNRISDFPDCANQIKAQAALVKKTQKSVNGVDSDVAITTPALVIGSGFTFLSVVGAISPLLCLQILAATGVVVLIGSSLALMEYKEQGHLQLLVKAEELPVRLGKVAAVLPYLDRNMAYIAGRLRVFQSVGTVIANELLEIQSVLQATKSSCHDRALSQRLTDVKHICQALQPALRRYQTATNMNWAQPPPPYSSD